MQWKIVDQILLFGPSATDLSSSGIPQMWLVDLQVTSHPADGRQWGEKKKSKNNEQNIFKENKQAQEGKVFFNSHQSHWKHLTTLETNEILFEAIAFLLEIQSAVGLFLLLLFISISN